MKLRIGIALIGLLVCCSMGHTANGQVQKVAKSFEPEVFMGGDFKKGIVDTSVGKYAISYFPSWTILDTVSHTPGANDSVRCKVTSCVNEGVFEIHVKRVGSVAIDSGQVQVWATYTQGNGQGSYFLATTFTLANTANEQVFRYCPTLTLGSMPSNVRISASAGNLVANSKFSYQCWFSPH